jgi:hypothetical protein
MSTPSIRATLERLVELHDAEAAWGLHWDEAIDAAHAALAQPEGEGPSAADLLPANPPNIPTTMALRCRSAWYEGVEDGWNEARAILARCGRPTALPAPEVREGPILQWTENMPPSEDCRYDHCTAETLFGRFLITWKSWKQFDGPTVDETPWGDWYGAFNSVDAAKAACQRGMDERLARWGRPAAPPAPEVGAALADLENLELAFESSFECKVRTSRIRPALLHYATLLQQRKAPGAGQAVQEGI